MNKVLILIVVVLFSLLSFSCDKDQTIPIKDPPGLKYDMVDWGKDGRHIAYVYMSTSKVDTAGIYIYDLADSTSRLLVGGDPLVLGTPLPVHPSFSPDCRWVAFSWYDQIWKIKVNGDSLTQLTFSEDEGKYFPAWSPDGERIAYSVSAGDKSGIYILDLDTMEERKVRGSATCPRWFPDGNRLVFHGCMLNDTCGIGITDTYNNNPIIIYPNALANHPSVSPSGERILFSLQFEREYPNIWIINVDGTGLTRLTADGGDEARWSPDGSKIIYTNVNERYGNLWIMDADGGNKSQFYPSENK